MRKKLEIVMSVLLLLGACAFAREGSLLVETMNAENAKICIVIDAGHGGC